MLTDTKVRQAKAQSKITRMFDGRGLYLEINPNGGKYWRFKYQFNNKEKRLGLGTYPDIGLADARDRCAAARKLVANGVDPAEAKQAQKEATSDLNTFEAVAREWHAKYDPTWSKGHGVHILRRLELNVFPWIGKKQISEIKAPELLAVLRRTEGRGALETAHRIRSTCGQIFRYAIATGRTDRDVAQDLRGAISPVNKQHFPTITNPKEVGALLRAMEVYEGSHVVRCALKLAPLLFVRPGELRHAEWAEFDLETAEWRIPAGKMKARQMHIVPLSKQVLAILDELRPLTGNGAAAKYLFPSVRSYARPMSDNTVNSALRRMGYEKEAITGHGFRSMASTLLNEQGWNRDAIERQLAHGERNSVRAAYNYAEYLPERRKMMQTWSDYLEKLKVGGDVVKLKKVG